MKAPHPFVRKVARWLRQHGVAPGGMTVAVSGGPDSVALLRALLSLRPKDRPTPVVVAHLNHRLRGEDSDADEDFVCRLHRDLVAGGLAGVGLRCDREDVAGRARREGGNLEAVARRARYDWLARVAREEQTPWLATGHTADDQAETVLHRLLRGAGLRGLRGIAAARALAPGVTLVRPLLALTRAEVLQFLELQGQMFCVDQTNADPRRTRNRIRHELLPLLAKRFNPGIVPSLTRLAAQADEAFRDVRQRAEALLAQAERPRAGGTVVLDRSRLTATSGFLLREMFRLVWEREGWPQGDMGHAHWQRLAALAGGRESALELPDGVRAHCREHVVQLSRRP